MTAVVAGQPEGIAAICIERIEVDTEGQQLIDDLQAAELGGAHQRCKAAIGLGSINVGAVETVFVEEGAEFRGHGVSCRLCG